MTLSKCVSLHLTDSTSYIKVCWSGFWIVITSLWNFLLILLHGLYPRLQQRLKERRWSCLLFSVLIISVFCLFWAETHNSSNCGTKYWKSGWCYVFLVLFFCNVPIKCNFLPFLKWIIRKREEEIGLYSCCFKDVSFQLPDANLDYLDRNSHANGIKVTQIKNKSLEKPTSFLMMCLLYLSHIWTPKIFLVEKTSGLKLAEGDPVK